MEASILAKAIQKFEEIIGENVDRDELSADQAEDGLLTLKVKKAEKKFRLQTQRNINSSTPALLAQQQRIERQSRLLITHYVTPPIGEKLKSLDIQFLDTAGNAYLNFSQVFIYVTGKKPTQRFLPGTVSRAFKPKGLQVIFALLRRPELANAPLRTLAEVANVSLGSVQWTIKDLQKLGFLVDMGKKGKRMIKKAELLNRWIQLYNEQLRPKLVIGKFRSKNEEWWMSTSILKLNSFWGGEIAGNLFTGNLKPEIVTIYTHQPPGELIIAHKLRKDETGNIEILSTFWNPEVEESSEEMVHPFLVYADLVSSRDDRNLEVANQIYDEKIADLIKEV